MVTLCATLYSQHIGSQAERLLGCSGSGCHVICVAFRVSQRGNAAGVEKVWNGIDLPQRSAEG